MQVVCLSAMMRCNECGVCDDDTDYDDDTHENVHIQQYRSIALCDICLDAIIEAEDEINTQACLNNWIINGIYCFG